MARRFNSSSDVVTFTLSAAVQTLTAGGLTMVAVVSPNDTTDGAYIHSRTSGGTNCFWMECFAGVWNYGSGTTAKNVGALSASDGWEALIGRKVAGGANAPTGRRIVFGGSTFDVTAGTGLADGSPPGVGGILQAGKWGAASEVIGADIAALALYNSVLSDPTTATFTTYAALLAAGPVWCVPFNQANAGDAIPDDSGNGGGSATITGTTIVADPPGFFAASASAAPPPIVAPSPAVFRATW